MVSIKKYISKHIIVMILSGILVYAFYLSRPEFSFGHRIWRATGDAAFILLFLALVIGPLAIFWPFAKKGYPIRRQLGIWFAIVSIVHGYLILNDWIQWNWLKFWGFEYVPQLERYARIDPGFGLANLLGVMALFFAIILLLSSSDKAMRYLGGSSWKWIHSFGYTIFYLVSAHLIYYLFIHFKESFHTRVIPENWFKYYALGMMIILVGLQFGGFIKRVRDRRKSFANNGD